MGSGHVFKLLKIRERLQLYSLLSCHSIKVIRIAVRASSHAFPC